MSVAASMEMRFFREEALLAHEMSCVPSQPSAGLAQVDRHTVPGMGFILSDRQSPSGWLRLFSFSLGAYLPHLSLAGSRVSLEKKIPAPDLINSLPF